MQPDDVKLQKVCRRSDLPLYPPTVKVQNISYNHPANNSIVYDKIESGVRFVRVNVQESLDKISGHTQVVTNYYETAKAHTLSTIDYLNQPQNSLPRGGAIAIGGLAGLIFAGRGGFIKKLFYTGIGGGAMASLCYPQQAEHVARDALVEARKTYAIAYNFVKGVKPGSDEAIDTLNKFPTNLQDLKFMFWDLYDEAKDTIFSRKK